MVLFVTGNLAGHSFFYSNTGVFGWGWNLHGQLGNGNNIENNFIPMEIKNLPFKSEIKKIACGSTHTLLLTKNEKAFSCGSNNDGQLGHGDEKNRNKFEEIKYFVNKKVKNIFSGIFHSFFVTEKNEIFSCGRNDYSSLGIINVNVEVRTPQKVNIPIIIRNIKVSRWFSVFLSSHGAEGGLIYKAGEFLNEGIEVIPKRISFFTLKDPVVKHSAGGCHYLCLTQSNKLYSIGNGKKGELGFGKKLKTLKIFKEINFFKGLKVKQVSCGDHHSFVLLFSGVLYSFGWNEYGELGIGNKEMQYSPQNEISKNIKIERILSFGNGGIAFTQKNKQIFVVGYNESGELGVGDGKERLEFVENKKIIVFNPIPYVEDDEKYQILKIFMKKTLSFLDVIIKITPQ